MQKQEFNSCHLSEIILFSSCNSSQSVAIKKCKFCALCKIIVCPYGNTIYGNKLLCVMSQQVIMLLLLDTHKRRMRCIFLYHNIFALEVHHGGMGGK